MKDDNNLKIAIDGFAATGKSTVSKKVALHFNLTYINTGQVYRLVTLFAIDKNLINEEKQLYKKLTCEQIWFDGEEIKSTISFSSKDLTSIVVHENVSQISSLKLIRKYVTKILINSTKNKNVILEGRDIGSIVMPKANFKFFLTVSEEEAAKRRFNELKKNNISITLKEILNQIKSRNKKDSQRKVNPLIKTKDAIEIDTTNKNPDQVSNHIIKIVQNEK